MFLIAFKVDWTQSRDKRLVLMVCNAMRPRSPLSHLMIKSLFLFFYQTLASPGVLTYNLLLTLTFRRKVIFASDHQVLVGYSDFRDVASCPSKLPFADADLQSTTWFALCLLICTNLTPQFFGEPFSSSHSSVQQFLYHVNLNAITEACDKKQLRHAFTLAKKPLLIC